MAQEFLDKDSEADEGKETTTLLGVWAAAVALAKSVKMLRLEEHLEE